MSKTSTLFERRLVTCRARCTTRAIGTASPFKSLTKGRGIFQFSASRGPLRLRQPFRKIVISFAGLVTGPVVLGLLLPGCGSSALQADLFSVDFVAAPYPVMLSPGTACAGRPIQAKSGDYSSSNQHYWERRWNVVGASQQLAHQVNASDTCVQIDRVAFDAKIEWGFGPHKLDKELTIDASVAP